MNRSLLQLPLAEHLPQFLTPDAATPSAAGALSLSEYSAQADTLKPSTLRRSRRIQAGAHFSFVTPLPVAFPYAISEELYKQVKREDSDEISIEDVLAKLEPEIQKKDELQAYTSNARSQNLSKAELFGLSQSCLDELLPNLDVGDAFQVLKTQDYSVKSTARDDLINALSGKTVIARLSDDKDKVFAPWSLCYSGWQFGVPAGQLGDGRAISIMTTPSPAKFTKTDSTTFMPQIAELQLKGAGRTPYSRFADGLAVLRSSVREYLGSEAMAALNIPTSRALSLIHLPDLEVRRERMETAAVVCRVAPSWLRFGSFQIQRENQAWDALLQLTHYAVEHLYGYEPNSKQRKSAGRTVLREAAIRNAKMCAGWQVYGFMHGVMNTDNINCLGLTIDYGPFAFMDVYSAGHICNHSDDGGRYSYRNQPAMIEFAIRKLGDALAEIIGAEGKDGKSLQEGWASDSSALPQWREQGLQVVDEIVKESKTVFSEEYCRLFAQRLGFADIQASDKSQFFDRVLDLMAQSNLDFTNTFRVLCQFRGTDDANFDQFLAFLLPKDRLPKYQIENAPQTWTSWLKEYETRLEESEKSAGLSTTDRQVRMQQHNPRFTLRQWLLEETIKRLDESKDTAFLSQVLEMCNKPFEAYGEEIVGEDSNATCPDKLTQEQRRLCSLGSKDLLGFQCSCSS